MTPNISASKRAVKCWSSGRSITIGCCVVKATAKDSYTQRVLSQSVMCRSDELQGTLAVEDVSNRNRMYQVRSSFTFRLMFVDNMVV